MTEISMSLFMESWMLSQYFTNSQITLVLVTITSELTLLNLFTLWFGSPSLLCDSFYVMSNQIRHLITSPDLPILMHCLCTCLYELHVCGWLGWILVETNEAKYHIDENFNEKFDIHSVSPAFLLLILIHCILGTLPPPKLSNFIYKYFQYYCSPTPANNPFSIELMSLWMVKNTMLGTWAEALTSIKFHHEKFISLKKILIDWF